MAAKPRRRAVGERREQRHRAGHVAPARARAPRQQRSLERAHARRDEIDVRDAAPPPLPRAHALVARGDPPARVGADEPVVRALDPGSAGEARTDRVAERLQQGCDLRAVHPERPEAWEDRVGGREGLGAEGRGEHEPAEQGESSARGTTTGKVVLRGTRWRATPRLRTARSRCWRTGPWSCFSMAAPHWPGDRIRPSGAGTRATSRMSSPRSESGMERAMTGAA
jgi:hypothetical protein